MKAILLFAALIFQCGMFSLPNFAISGSVTDQETKEILPFANVVLYQDGVLVEGTTSDVNGMYELKNIPKGEYELKISFLGYTVETVEVELGEKPLMVDASLQQGVNLKEVVIESVRPVIETSFIRTRCSFGRRYIRILEEEPEEVTLQQQKREHLELFPNPSIGENVTLIYDNGQLESEASIELLLLNVLGKTIARKTVKLERGRVELQLKELEGIISGQYFVIVADGEEKTSQKIIIQ